jgi:hypothetical protein
MPDVIVARSETSFRFIRRKRALGLKKWTC